jgi:hypothetical protein
MYIKTQNTDSGTATMEAFRVGNLDAFLAIVEREDCRLDLVNPASEMMSSLMRTRHNAARTNAASRCAQGSQGG